MVGKTTARGVFLLLACSAVTALVPSLSSGAARRAGVQRAAAPKLCETPGAIRLRMHPMLPRAAAASTIHTHRGGSLPAWPIGHRVAHSLIPEASPCADRPRHPLHYPIPSRQR